MIVSTAALLGATLGSAALSSIGNFFTAGGSAKKSYKYNLALQQQAQAWQERMANTAHQREVADLRAAGLNPILSATGGNGASTGSAGANSAQVTTPQFDFSKVLTDYAALKENQAKVNNINQDTLLKESQMFKAYQETDNLITEKENLIKSGKLTDVQIDKVKSEIDVLKQQRESFASQIELNNSNIKQNATVNEMLERQNQWEKDNPGYTDFGYRASKVGGFFNGLFKGIK